MLHRRPGSTSSPSSQPLSSHSGSSSRPTKATSNINKAYTPLRRQSANLYPDTANNNNNANYGGRSAPRYSIPQSSPLNLGGPSSSSTSTYNVYGGGGGGGGGLGSPGYNSTGTGTFDLNFDFNSTSGLPGSDSWGDASQVAVTRRLREWGEHLIMGLKDAGKLTRSWELVWSDRELRTLVLKSTMINILSLLSLSLGSLIFSPIFLHVNSSSTHSEILENKTKRMGMWYNLLLSWPVFVICFLVNASWGPSISKRAQAILHPSHRFQPSPTSTPTTSIPSSSFPKQAPFAKVFQSITRIILISDFTLISKLIGLIPFFGRWGSFAYMCVIDAYYCFEWNFTTKHWPLDHRVAYMQDRTAYMVGFGFLATFLTSFGPPLVNMAIFALIYPFFVLQAIRAKPPTPSSATSSSILLPSTPSPHASLPSSPIGGELSLNDSFFASADTSKSQARSSRIRGSSDRRFEVKLPIFWIAKYAIQGLKWFEDAAGRDRRGSTSTDQFSTPGNYGYSNNGINPTYNNNINNSSNTAYGSCQTGLGLNGVQQLNALNERKGKRLQ
ncbi:uncharacterized protein I303_104327 [Kwoniella dejecticola CBS 10117]|uniref:Etoposide-induced protein 2.4-domain-containing protein n=1 Tax=Kwoniella dejecticola CBS 10117 TaxID=1296121 RepID=A0A1A6A5N2_9TREE|nr:uncharacterized protein I303_04699 [Kwoniella dejecticola CBS 10117]OBR85364.1 hypothetical protein I303_04699 [Kwoniella dejecticola CBS 10117]